MGDVKVKQGAVRARGVQKNEPTAKSAAAVKQQASIRGDGFDAGASPSPGIQTNDQQVNLGDARQRRALALQATQVNEVSLLAGNHDDICGGAALASAIVLASNTPQVAAKNADALGKIFRAQSLVLPTGVTAESLQNAVTHLGNGTLSRDDLFQLQQGLYATTRAMIPTDGKAGVNVGQISTVVAELVGRGASFGDTTFSEVEVGSERTPHWVARTPDGVVNTGSSVVEPKWLNPKSERWSGEVKVSADVEFGTRVLITNAGHKKRADVGAEWRGRITPKDPNDLSKLAMPSVVQQLDTVLKGFKLE